MSENESIVLQDFIRDIPDFPKPGILYRDICPLLASPAALRATIRQFVDRFSRDKIDVIVAAEARGFIFATPLALELDASFVPIRKPGKLPSATHSFEYDLEYGHDTLEIHVDGVTEGQNVLVVDDLLATGGTVAACCKLLKKCGANVVGATFLIELKSLGGREAIAPCEVHSLIKY